jgi:hypothetical protein
MTLYVTTKHSAQTTLSIMTQYYDTRHNETHDKDTQHNETHDKDTQHKMQHKALMAISLSALSMKCHYALCLFLIVMQSVPKLCVVMLSAILASVVAPALPLE